MTRASASETVRDVAYEPACTTLNAAAGRSFFAQEQSPVLTVDKLRFLLRFSMPVQSPGFHVRRCHRRFDRLLNVVLSEHGLNTGHWYYLRALGQEDGLTQKQLSERTNVAENTTAAMINGMITAGLVARSRDDRDRRRMNIRLTPHGHALKERLMPYAQSVNEIATSDISAADMAVCLSVLERMSSNLREAFLAIPRNAGAKKD